MCPQFYMPALTFSSYTVSASTMVSQINYQEPPARGAPSMSIGKGIYNEFVLVYESVGISGLNSSDLK